MYICIYIYACSNTYQIYTHEYKYVCEIMCVCERVINYCQIREVSLGVATLHLYSPGPDLLKKPGHNMLP